MKCRRRRKKNENRKWRTYSLHTYRLKRVITNYDLLFDIFFFYISMLTTNFGNYQCDDNYRLGVVALNSELNDQRP